MLPEVMWQTQLILQRWLVRVWHETSITERLVMPLETIGNITVQSGWLKSVHENKAKLQWNSDKISKSFLILERIFLDRKTINVRTESPSLESKLLRPEMETSCCHLLFPGEPTEVPHRKPPALCLCCSRSLIISVNLGSCLYGNVARAGFATVGGGQTTSPLLATRLETCTASRPGGMEEKDKNEHVCIKNSIYVCVCNNCKKESLLCLGLGLLIGPAGRKGHGWWSWVIDCLNCKRFCPGRQLERCPSMKAFTR